MITMVDVTAPFDGAHVGQVAASSAEDVERALSTAHALFRDRRQWLPKQQRIAILRRAAEIITSRRETIARQAAHEGGKPYKDSLVEVDRGIDGINTCIEELRTKSGHVIPMDLNATSAGRVAFTQFEPIGVVVGVSAFNHPFNLVVHQVAPAVAVGAPVIIKPASTTPLSCKTLIDIFLEAGLPPGWAQMVLPVDLDLATRLVADHRVGFFSFIGSAAVGWMLRSKLAPGARCALEHGGVAPVIVSQDADLEMALPRLARGSFWHAGQACVGVQRVFCHRSIAGDVATGIARLGDKMVIGDPLLPTTDVGPLISHKEVNRVGSWVDEAVAGGGRLITGGEKVSASCYANTVLLDPPLDADVTRKEVFGPVVCIRPFDDEAQMLCEVNDSRYGLSGSIWTNDLKRALRVSRQVERSRSRAEVARDCSVSHTEASVAPSMSSIA